MDVIVIRCYNEFEIAMFHQAHQGQMAVGRHHRIQFVFLNTQHPFAHTRLNKVEKSERECGVVCCGVVCSVVW